MIFFDLLANFIFEWPTVSVLAVEEKEFNGKRDRLFLLAVPQLVWSLVHVEPGDQEHGCQSVLVKMMTGRKVNEFTQDGIIVFSTIFVISGSFLLGTPTFLWQPIHTEVEEPRQQVRTFLQKPHFLDRELPAILSSNSHPAWRNISFYHIGCINVRLKFSCQRLCHNRHFLQQCTLQVSAGKESQVQSGIYSEDEKTHNLKQPLTGQCPGPSLDEGDSDSNLQKAQYPKW